MRKQKVKRPVENMVSRFGSYIFELGSDFSQNLASCLRDVPENLRAIPDQAPVQDFNRGDSGWPMSDITALVHAQSDIEIERVAQRLIERKQTNNTDGLSDQEIIADIIPRFVNDQASLYQYIYNRTVVDAPQSASATVEPDKPSVEPSSQAAE